MIINTGSRTDIPAYFSDWFFNRITEGYVLVRNPYYPSQVTKYLLDPKVVDAIIFCTKNPEPMLGRIDQLSRFSMLWFVTITPYGKEIEPFVPEKDQVLASFWHLSKAVGIDRVIWRYDPVFLSDTYPADCHIRCFEKMAKRLKGYTEQCVVSFIDLYEKTKRNFPEAGNVAWEEQKYLIEAFGEKISPLSVSPLLQVVFAHPPASLASFLERPRQVCIYVFGYSIFKVNDP